MSTKLSFRARALDPSKPMPIYLEEELPDLHEYSAINRAVPQMPSGMEKEEESEHHLQRAIVAGLIIPTPDVTIIEELEAYERLYPPDFKMPRQLIHVQPLSLEQDIPDYDMDSEDEHWLDSESKSDLTPYRFEQMMDKLEKGSTCTLDDAKALVKRNEVSQEVFDYWVSKRLKTKHPLLLTVKTECRGGTTINNPYIAFRRRTEKMQTRKNRKNDEASYEKMLKLRRDLSRAVKLLEMVKRREKMKKEDLQLSIDIYEKRYQAKDYTGQLLQEYTAATNKSRPAFAPLYSNQFYHNTSSNLVSHSNQWNSSQNYPSIHLNHHHLQNKRDFDGMSTSSSRKEKRQYKKRKHKPQREQVIKQETYDGIFSSDDEDLSTQLGASESEDEGIYPFRRNRNCNYFKPYSNDFGDWPWESQQNNHLEDPRYRYSLTSLRHPRPRCIGFARRRVGRGGRIILDRVSSSYDDIWSKLDFTIIDNEKVPISDESDRLPATNDSNSEICNQSAVTLSATVCSSAIEVSNNLTKLQQANHFYSNIVIKSENSIPSEITNSNISDDQSGSRVSDHDQKLDDFEQLLDSANASSNIINKNLVCKKSNHDIINNDGFHLKTIAQNSSLSEVISSNSNKINSLGVLNSFIAPDTNTTGISSTNSAGSLSSAQSQKLEFDFSIPTISSLAATSTTNQMIATPSNGDELSNEHDSYRELFEEIQDDWLHFQPLSPPLSPSENLIFDSDLMSDMKKFSVELQMLDNNSSFYAENETENNTTNCIDSSTYLTHPMTFNCRNNSLEILNVTNTTQHDSIPSTSSSLSSEVVTIKTEPIDEESKENVQMTNCIDGDAENIADDKDEFSMLINNLDYTKPLFDSSIGCSEFKLINEKALMQQLEIVPMETESSQSDEIAIKTELVEQHVVNSIAPIAIIKEAPIAELQTHNYVLQYGSPVSTPPTIVQNDNIKYTTSNLNATITNSTNLMPQQFVNTGNTITSSASPSQQSKMQSIVYDNNTFVLTAAPQRKQLNGPADRGLNQNQKFKQVFMVDFSQAQDKRKAIGALNESNLIKKSYSDLGLSSQNILVQSLNSNLNSNNIGQQSQQFSLVHQKPMILGASTSGGGGTFMQSTAGGNTTNKIIVTPTSQLSGNIYMSTHGKLVIPSSNQQSIILDNAKMITTNQMTSQPQVQQTSQQKLQQSPSNQQRVKMENKMNMLIESTGEKSIIIAKYNKNNKIFQNVIPVAAANKNSTQSPTTKQISQITSSQQPQQQSISVVSSKPIQRIPGSLQTQQQQILRTQQFGASSVNFQNSPTTKIIQQQQSNNGSTVKSNDNSSTSPR